MIHKISEDCAVITVDIVCYEDEILLAREIESTFKTRCFVSKTNRLGPFGRIYTFMTNPEGGVIRNLNGLARSVRSKLINVVATMDDVELALPV